MYSFCVCAHVVVMMMIIPFVGGVIENMSYIPISPSAVWSKIPRIAYGVLNHNQKANGRNKQTHT